MPQWFHANLSSLIKTLGDQLVFSTKVVILSVVGSHLTLVTYPQCLLKKAFYYFFYSFQFSSTSNLLYDFKSRFFEDFYCFCHYWKSDIFASSPFILLLGFFPIDSVILAHLLFLSKVTFLGFMLRQPARIRKTLIFQHFWHLWANFF